MKPGLFWLLLLVLFPWVGNAQNITTFAGGGTSGVGDSGPATAAVIEGQRPDGDFNSSEDMKL